MLYPILYSRTSTGKIYTWQVERVGGSYRVYTGEKDGKIVTSEFTACEPKNIGKKNETSAEQQCEKECLALIKKKKKEQYFEDIKLIDNELFISPMLAKGFEDYKEDIEYPVILNFKYNGIRAIVTKDGAFSRKGERFYCIEHIIEGTKHLFDKYPNLVLDGELYNEEYRNKLNRIASLVSVNRKEKDVTPEDIEESKKLIKLYVYDGYGFNGVTEETGYQLRMDELTNLVRGIRDIQAVEYWIAHSEAEVRAKLARAVSIKMEGVMVKLIGGKYEHKRSKNILKLKNWIDAEFKVVDIQEGKGNWKGAAKRIVCELSPGQTFDSNIRGTFEELVELYNNRANFIGKFCTVRYQELSEYGVPLIGYTELPFRNYE